MRNVCAQLLLPKVCSCRSRCSHISYRQKQSFGHTGKVAPGTQDPGPSSGTLWWDHKVGPYGGTLRWDLSMRRKSSHSQLFFKIGVLKHFAIFTGKHLSWNLLLISKTPTQVFSCEYCKIFKCSFLYRTILVAASGKVSKTVKSEEMKINCLNPAYGNGCNAYVR